MNALPRGQQVGSRIRARRLQMGVSAQRAADRYARKTGESLTRQGWAYWERHGCDLDRIDAVAAVLEVSPAELLGFKEELAGL